MADPIAYLVKWSEVNAGMMEMAMNVGMVFAVIVVVIEFRSLAEMVKDGGAGFSVTVRASRR